MLFNYVKFEKVNVIKDGNDKATFDFEKKIERAAYQLACLDERQLTLRTRFSSWTSQNVYVLAQLTMSKIMSHMVDCYDPRCAST